MATVIKPEPSGRVYTMDDLPKGMHPVLWRKMIEQGTVESSRGENLPEVTETYWETDEEFDAFLRHIAERRARSRKS